MEGIQAVHATKHTWFYSKRVRDRERGKRGEGERGWREGESERVRGWEGEGEEERGKERT